MKYLPGVFEKANATVHSTADDRSKLFQLYAAGLLLDILVQFGQLDPQIAEKR